MEYKESVLPTTVKKHVSIEMDQVSVGSNTLGVKVYSFPLIDKL
ncbi:hypothetical protein [Paraliobacillus ryukyuensis]|nr:hypothetical protein [Paraliobacillus ryukyuensis]